LLHNGGVPGRAFTCGIAVVALTACGRLGFDHSPGASIDDAAADAVTDAGTDGAGADPLSVLDDPFEGNGLQPDWAVLNPSDVDLVVAGGALTITPIGTGYWFDGGQGGLVHKTVTSDFVMTAEVSVENTVMPGIPVASNCLGLIMARDPAAPPQNNVWIGIGTVTDQWSVEPKNTINSVSQYMRSDWSQRAILRICRVGTTFRMLVREPASSLWAADTEYVRPDLPGSLQVGLSAACTTTPLELAARFEAITFTTPTGPGDCTDL
jgi:hypothetical protein